MMRCQECGQDRGGFLASCSVCGANAPRPLTKREQVCLAYLDNNTAVDALAAGRVVYDSMKRYALAKRGGSNLSAIGAVVLGRLRRKGYVLRVADAWRINSDGRQALRDWVNT